MENIEEWKFRAVDIEKLIKSREEQIQRIEDEINEKKSIIDEAAKRDNIPAEDTFEFLTCNSEILLLQTKENSLKNDIDIINENIANLKEQSDILRDLAARTNELSDEEKEKFELTRDNIVTLRKVLAGGYGDEIRVAMEERLSKEDKTKSDDAPTMQDDSSDVPNDKDVEELNTLLKNIDETNKKFLSYNTELFTSNNGNLERFVADFSVSLDRRSDEIEQQIRALNDAIASNPDNAELEEKKKILEGQTQDIENDFNVIEEWQENREKLDKNIKEVVDIQKENRKIAEKIKEITTYITDSNNKLTKEQIEEKQNEIKSLFDKKKGNIEKVESISKDNKKIFESLDKINDKFKTVSKDIDIQKDSQTEKDKTVINASQQEQQPPVQQVEQQDSPQTGVPTGTPTPTQQQPNAQGESMEEETPEEVQQPITNLPNLSYKEIINTYIDTPSGSKTNQFLRHNFSNVMVALNDSIQKGKLSGTQKQELKEALSNHKHEIDHTMEMFGAAGLSNIVTNLFKDDEEKLNEYTYVDEQTGERKLNNTLFASIYKKEKLGEERYKCTLKDMSEMGDDEHNFISSMFIKYDHMLKDGSINENSELYKQFNKYVADPVKYQMIEKSGNRACKQNFFQRIKDKFSRPKEDKADYLKEFLIKVEKSRDAASKDDSNDRLGLGDSVVQDPPAIDNKSKEKDPPDVGER